MGNSIVEYWTKKKLIASVVGTYVPKNGDWVYIRRSKKVNEYKPYQVIDIHHKIDSVSNISTLEYFIVVLQ